jgi:hypothetical protein
MVRCGNQLTTQSREQKIKNKSETMRLTLTDHLNMKKLCAQNSTKNITSIQKFSQHKQQNAARS